MCLWWYPLFARARHLWRHVRRPHPRCFEQMSIKQFPRARCKLSVGFQLALTLRLVSFLPSSAISRVNDPKASARHTACPRRRTARRECWSPVWWTLLGCRRCRRRHPCVLFLCLPLVFGAYCPSNLNGFRCSAPLLRLHACVEECPPPVTVPPLTPVLSPALRTECHHAQNIVNNTTATHWRRVLRNSLRGNVIPWRNLSACSGCSWS